MNNFHISIIDGITTHMDYLTLARFSSTCGEYRHYGRIPYKQMARRELSRCADIYNCIEYATVEEMDELDGIGIGPSPIFEEWERKWGLTTATRIQATLMDKYYARPPSSQYRHHDPELFDLIRDDVRMLAPQDSCLTYHFYKSVYSVP